MNRTTVRSMIGLKVFMLMKNRDFLLTFSMFALDVEILKLEFDHGQIV